MTHSYFLFLKQNPKSYTFERKNVLCSEAVGEKMFHLQMLIVMVTIALVFGPTDDCIETQYKHKGICCPMCNPGHRVKEHCENDSGTNCHPCDIDTYQNSVNGIEKCIPCSACGEGMYPINPCTATEDTVCDCSEGYHCENIKTDGCKKCTKHSTCKPGEMRKRKGSYRNDTVCLPSPGSNEPEEMPTKLPKAGTNDDASGRTGHTPGGCPASILVIFSVIIGFLILVIIMMLWRPDICPSAIRACLKHVLPQQVTKESAEAGLQIPVQEELQEHGQDVAVSVEEVAPLIHPGPISGLADGKLLIEKDVRQLNDSRETVNLSSVKLIDDDAE